MTRAAALVLLAAGAALAADAIDVANRDLDELSGLAVSRADPGLLWGHNDTGSGPLLFRIGPRGEDLGVAPLPEAGAMDWEDIAAFEDKGEPALLVADVGDNLAIRAFATLYAVRDPGRAGDATVLWRLDFEFPDGPRDCEAVAVDMATRSILLVSKRDTPPRLYRLPLPERPPRRRRVAEYLGEMAPLPAPTLRERVIRRFAHSPTALAISRDGATAVLATPSEAFVYRRAAGASLAQALLGPGSLLPLPALGQVEAAALSADGRELVVGSEGRPSRLARVALPLQP